jgi:hypothetical protein
MIQIQTQVTLETLIDSLKQLNKDELEQVAQQTAVLRARHIAGSIPAAEADLLLKINQCTVPEYVRTRSAELSAKSGKGDISEPERNELMALIDQIENLNAERMGYLAQLAALRQTSLETLMNSLEIQPLSYE